MIVLFCKDYMHINVAPLPVFPAQERAVSLRNERPSIQSNWNLVLSVRRALGQSALGWGEASTLKLRELRS
jgi:hypothetical protein